MSVRAVPPIRLGALFCTVAAAAALVLLPSACGEVPKVSTEKKAIQYFLSPHPDDIFMGWSLAQDSPDNYPVFITLTMGESTGTCRPDGSPLLAVAYWGTFDRSAPAGCKGARMASLNNWLDDQSDTDAYLNDYVRAEHTDLGFNMVKYVETVPAGGKDRGAPTAAGMVACGPVWSKGSCSGRNPNVGAPVPDNLNNAHGENLARQVTWYVGSTSARVQFDLGDGNVTVDEIVWAVKYVRAQRGKKLPLEKEYGVVAAGYSNLGGRHTACPDYSNHDHRALHEAVYGIDLIPDKGSHPQWGVTCGSETTRVGIDPQALPENGGRAVKITDVHYSENMSSASASFQKRFGWLHDGTLWPSGPDPVGSVMFAQWNYFWCRFA